MNIDRMVLDFLSSHKDADEIVVNGKTGMPIKAIYSGPDCTGNPRTKPAVFWFDVGGDEE